MTSHPKIAFFGTPSVASETLEHMISSGFVPSLVITGEDKKVGRHFTLTKTPTRIVAEKNNIPVLTPEKLDDTFFEELKKYDCEVFIVVAYGKIIPENIIKLPKLGTYNIHYSLLPRWRGATPVESAILSDDKETGVTIQKMEYKLDSGEIISTEKTNIQETETTEELRKRLIEMGSKMLVRILPDIFGGSINPIKQDESLVTKCHKIKKEDADITNITDDRKKWLMYRAYFSWPRVYFMKDGKRYIVTSATYKNARSDDEVGRGTFIIERVIPEGKKETDFSNI